MSLLQTLFLPLALLASTASTAVGDGFLGVFLEDRERGPTVVRIIENTAAAKSDLKVGDIFLSVDGKKTPDTETFVEVVGARNAGDRVRFDILRGEREITLFIRLGTRPAEIPEMEELELEEGEEHARAEKAAAEKAAAQKAAAQKAAAQKAAAQKAAAEKAAAEKAAREAKEKAAKAAEREGLTERRREGAERGGRAFLGVQVEDAEDGVRIAELVEGGPAARAGLAPGDYIVRLGRAGDIRTLEDLRAALGQVSPGQTVRVRVRRGEQAETMPVTLGRAGGEAAERAEERAGQERRGEGRVRGVEERARPDRQRAETERARAEAERARAAPRATRSQPSSDLQQLRQELKELREEIRELKELVRKLNRDK